MADETIRFTVSDKAVQDAIRRAGAAATDFREPFGRLALFTEREWDKGFLSGGASLGAKWAALKPSTVRARLRSRGGNRGGINRPLWDRADLKRSVTFPGPNSIRVVSRDGMVRGTQDPKARYHQTGTRKMVARPLVTTTLKRRVGKEGRRLVRDHLARVL